MEGNIIMKDIEFYSLSGAGKTTLLKKLIGDFEKNNIKYNLFSLELSSRFYKVKKIFISLAYIILNPIFSFDLLKLLWNKRIDNMYYILRAYLNILFICFVKEYFQKNNIFDEGIMQNLWSLIYDSKNNNFSNIINFLIKYDKFPDKIIILDLDDKVIKNRLLNRKKDCRLKTDLHKNEKIFYSKKKLFKDIKNYITYDLNLDKKILIIKNKNFSGEDLFNEIFKDEKNVER